MSPLRQVLANLVMLAALSYGLTSACKQRVPEAEGRTGDSPALGPVTLKPIPAVAFRGQELHIDQEELLAKVKTVLGQSQVFAAARPGRPAVVVSLEVVPFTEGSAEALEMDVNLRLRATIRPENSAPARFAEDVAAVGQAPLHTRDANEARAAFQRLAERTAEDLVQSYLARQTLWVSDGKQIAAALGSPDSDLRIEALRIVGARQLRELASSALRLLEDEDEGVRDAALGTLVALREPTAVKTLAASRQMRDTREMRKILDAMATLGGAEAQDYLAFVAENHDDEEIRVMAKAALDRMARRVNMGKTTR